MMHTQKSSYSELKEEFAFISNLNGAGEILGKDSQTFMPKGSQEDRSQQMQAIARACHQLITNPHIGKLLNQAEAEHAALPPADQRNLFLMRRQWGEANSIPPELAKKRSHLVSNGEFLHDKWKPVGDWSKMRDWYAHAFDVAREVGEAKKKALPGFASTYEALMDSFSPGMRDEVIAREFAELERVLPSMIKEALEKQASQSPAIPLQGVFPEEQQEELCRRLVKAVGFDFNRGRFDMSHSHPSCGGTSDDSRITAQCDKTDFFSAIYGVVHESGHGNYEQNLPKEWRYQPAGNHLGMGVHESQSRIIEVVACHTPEFFQFLEGQTREVFKRPDDPALSAANLEKIANQVTPSLIRIYADEMTYPAHVILRYRLEKALIEGTMKIDDLPHAWNEGMKTLLGITPPNPSQGHMQDVHWPAGMIGYFPAYTIGDMGAAQLAAAAYKQERHSREWLEFGNFKYLNQWLKKNVHGKGSLETPEELFRQATGEGLNVSYYLNHLSTRYLDRPHVELQRNITSAVRHNPLDLR